MNQAFLPTRCLLCVLATSANTVAAYGQLLESQTAEPANIAAIVDRAEQALDENQTEASALLSDPEFLAAHPWPRFRQLIRDHAPSTPMTIVVPDEPGKRIRVRVRLVEPDGSPSTGALVYFYHTDNDGEYGPNPANVPPASDNNSARLFGYAKSDSDGLIDFQTIRPGGYPGTSIPQHIHLRVWCPDRRVFGGEIQFADDPRIDQAARDEAARIKRVVICPVVTGGNGLTSVKAEIRLD